MGPRASILRLLAAAALLAALLVGGARPAAADDQATRTARAHWERGEKLFALGRFAEALAAYEQAFEAKPLPGFLFNIGQCHRNLGDHDAAIFSFRKYLRLAPEADNRAAVLALIDELEARQAEEAAARQRRAFAEPDPRGAAPAGRERRRPLYKTWWFWTGVAAVAGAGGAGTYFLLRDDGVPASDLGHVVFR
jgi:tetratricopeptide (TPR) repeat protein